MNAPCTAGVCSRDRSSRVTRSRLGASRVAENRSTRTGTTSPTARTPCALRGGGVMCSGRNSRAQDIVEKGTVPCADGASSTRASRAPAATTMPA